MKRVLLFGLAAMLLSGCGPSVYSARPLFGSAEAGGVAGGGDETALQPGIWISDDLDEHCRPSLHRPIGRWEGCESWMLVRDRDILQVDDEGDWTRTRLLIVSGTRMIWQYGPDEETTDPDRRYGYFGMKPLARDREGRVTRLTIRSALCGPPKPEPGRAEAKAPWKLDPAGLLPGLAPSASGSDCVASDQAAVRRAAAFGAEHPEWTFGLVLRWVREARPDDFQAH